MTTQSMKRIAAAAMAFAMVCGGVQAAPGGYEPVFGVSVSAAEMTDAEKLADAVQKVESGNFGDINGSGYDAKYDYIFDDLPLSMVEQAATNSKNVYISYWLSPAFDGTGVKYSVDLSFTNIVNKDENDFIAGERLADFSMVITLTCGSETQTVTKTGECKRTNNCVLY